ncbi:MAG: hypothetical protein QOI89_3116 [Solirubrobacteraceae bacterium]|nr:hypothetical protein [Solirubrobacteraceae bacterium]
MRPQSDEFPAYIERAVVVTLQEGIDAGRAELQPIAHAPLEIARRPSLSRELRCRVFKRDHFMCRYCGGKTILTPVMELLARLYPDIFPFESDAWRGGVTHPAFAARSPMVDHIVPGRLGGDWTAIDNLATACNPCNAIKADFTLEQLGWRQRPVPATDWAGLTEHYAALWQRAGRPDQQRHLAWFRDLDIVAA